MIRGKFLFIEKFMYKIGAPHLDLLHKIGGLHSTLLNFLMALPPHK